MTGKVKGLKGKGKAPVTGTSGVRLGEQRPTASKERHWAAKRDKGKNDLEFDLIPQGIGNGQQ